jgi:hypothetical protein
MIAGSTRWKVIRPTFVQHRVVVHEGTDGGRDRLAFSSMVSRRDRTLSTGSMR